MKLKRFTAKGVRGYMNFDIKFRDSVTFLIGINGSGKTTVLRLLSGLLSPSFIELSQIEFTSLILLCESDKKMIEITCEQSDRRLKLSYSETGDKEPIIEIFSRVEPKNHKEQLKIDAIDSQQMNLCLKFEGGKVFNKIASLKAPLFLGLNRRVSNNRKSSNTIPNLNLFDTEHWNLRTSINNTQLDSVDQALKDIQEMIFYNIRQNAKSLSLLSDDFRKHVFTESFSFHDSSPMINPINKNDINKLHDRKENLDKAILNLNIDISKQRIDDYFEKTENALNILLQTPSLNSEKKLNEEYYNALIKWMINSAQMEQVDKIIEYGKSYAEKTAKLNEPINRFVDSVNLFFKECQKTIQVNGNGDIQIKIKSKRKNNNIFELSSGEKQLVIMMAHLTFYKKNENSEVFIIDEPELSLHITWQEIFIDALLKANPDMQFIMATHAPAILAKNERKTWCEDFTQAK